MISTETVKKLREKTGFSVIECKKALEGTGGDEAAAEEILRKRGAEIAEKKSERQTKSGLISSYIHSNQKIGVLLQLDCETDFVAKNENFVELSHNICLHLAAVGAQSNEELLSQPFIKDPEKTIQNLINETVGRLGENIQLNRFVRFDL
jgi:elongation factor Ts